MSDKKDKVGGGASGTKSKSDPTEEPTSSGSGITSQISNLLNSIKLTPSTSCSSSESTSSNKAKILETPDLQGIKKYIESGKCQNIIVMAGAGISTSAGIPDFRSPGSGLYANISSKYDLPDPQVLFEISFFKRNPKPFYSLAKEILPENYNPTPSHYFVRLLHEKGLLLRHYTQNVDGLERKAGLPEDKIVEAHGSFYTSHCTGHNCGKEYDFEWMKTKIRSGELPYCLEPRCGKIVKPDVIFFGESLPPRFFHLASTDLPKCELLIIMGTSLVVQPFASLLDRAPKNCPRILINRELVGEESNFLSELKERFGVSGLGREGLDFGDPLNRDFAIVGDCDEGVMKIAEVFGWKDELEELIKNHSV